METFSETQKQQMTMMSQFIGAMTQFMSKNTESSPPKWTVKCIWHSPIFLSQKLTVFEMFLFDNNVIYFKQFKIILRCMCKLRNLVHVTQFPSYVYVVAQIW